MSPSCLELGARSEPDARPASEARGEVNSRLVDVQSLYAAHSTMVWRSLRRLGVSESLVEDAVQDVFVVAHRKSREYGGHSAPSTWLYGIALRVAKDYRRAEARREKRHARLTEEQATQPTVCEGPADALAKKEANRLLHALLDRLPPDQRETLVLVDLEGLSVAEVAPLIGLRLRTCQRRLKAARASFEAALAAHSIALHGGNR